MRSAPLEDVPWQVPTDVARKASVDNLVQRVTHELGDIDILVNNAAHGGHGPSLLDSDEERWDEIVDTNLKSVYLCCRAVASGMITRNRGSIINISSVDGLRPAGSSRIYGIAKAGVNFLTRGLALDLGPYNVRVNCVAPGAIKTDMLTKDVGPDPEDWERLDARIPLRRVGQPNDIGTAALFLASDATNYVTAQIIVVDAGVTA